MGSGETSPTMSKVHRDLFSRLGDPPVPAVLLDTPVGFQENADVISAKAVAYFAESVRRTVSVASFRSAASADALEYETMLARLREASYVFAGPGSPSYALAQWSGSEIPAVLGDKLRHGGCITFASAAAVTLGPLALPIYEIYKVGGPLEWLAGLDLLAQAGLAAVVIPHFDNAEGGNHDTRYCYMGERRLRLLEAMLPVDVFVLGVDEHTVCILDLDAATATVGGLGGVTVRRRGLSHRFESGETVSLAGLIAAADDGRGKVAGATPGSSYEEPAATGASATPDSSSPLLDETAAADAEFASALAAGDAKAAVKAALQLEQLLLEWSRDTLQSGQADHGRSILRSMLVRLGEAAERGVADPAEAVAPFVNALIDARALAREQRRWADADVIRDSLVGAGVEVNDAPEATTWRLAQGSDR